MKNKQKQASSLPYTKYNNRAMDSSVSKSENQTKPRGRPRSDASRKAIIDAAIRLSKNAEFQDITIENIAAKAKVGKQTIYRWWPNLATLLFETLHEVAARNVADVNDDLINTIKPDTFINSTFRVARKHQSALTKMLALSQLFEKSCKNSLLDFVETRRTVARKIFFKSSKIDQKQEFYLDLFFGFLWYGLLIRKETLSDVSIEQFITLFKQYLDD